MLTLIMKYIWLLMTHSLMVVYVVRKRIKLCVKKAVFIFVENMLPPTVENDSYNSVFFTWRCQRLECALDLRYFQHGLLQREKPEEVVVTIFAKGVPADRV